MTKLVLGVIDLPYADASYAEVRARKPKVKPGGSLSTGDVAQILEDRYAVMQAFYDLHGEQIANELIDAIEGAIESVNMGAPLTIDPVGSATSKIEDMFKQMLANKELDGRLGVPTLAAQEGHSKRFKQPYKKRAPRPSFIDTGLYQASFKAWLED